MIAVDLHKKLENPSYNHFMSIVKNNLIRDCPITTLDIKRALTIYCKDPATIKGKMKRQNPKPVSSKTIIDLSDYVVKWHLNVTLCIDIFYVNKMSFFHTISQTLYF